MIREQLVQRGMFINPNDFFNGDDCNPIFGRFDKKMFGNKHIFSCKLR